MKIVIYSICKNEEKFASRFAESAKDADSIIICDTGSNDETKNVLKKYPNIKIIDINVSPFRFDVARNIALDNVPDDADIVVSADLDDIFLPNWRKIIEDNWIKGETTMLNYPYIHAWEDVEQTIPRITILGFKIHCPLTYTWQYPIHEILTAKEGKKINEKIINEQILVHRPDWTKEERSTRLDIFKNFFDEYKNDVRVSYLFGRELFFHNRYKEALEKLKDYLDINKKYNDTYINEDHPSTRASACRMIAHCLIHLKKNPNEILVWFIRSVSESPSEREPWMWLAWAWAMVGDGFSAYAAAQRGVQITNELLSVEKEGRCWGQQAIELLNRTKEMMITQLNTKQ